MTALRQELDFHPMLATPAGAADALLAEAYRAEQEAERANRVSPRRALLIITGISAALWAIIGSVAYWIV